MSFENLFCTINSHKKNKELKFNALMSYSFFSMKCTINFNLFNAF